MTDLHLKRKTAIVEPITLSGLTDSGIYILDHDDAHGVDHRPVSLLYRVIQVGPECDEIESGKVYVSVNPYAFTLVTARGIEYYLMCEENLIAEVEGYDDKTEQLAATA